MAGWAAPKQLNKGKNLELTMQRTPLYMVLPGSVHVHTQWHHCRGRETVVIISHPGNIKNGDTSNTQGGDSLTGKKLTMENNDYRSP